jgi:hypothetical protein
MKTNFAKKASLLLCLTLIISVFPVTNIAYAASVNVAKLKPAFASSWYAYSFSYTPDRGNDENLGSEWVTDPLSHNANQYEYFAIDLLGQYKIDEIKMLFRITSGVEVRNFKILASNDYNFVNAVELVANVGSTLDPLPSDKWKTFTISDTTPYRYIKLEKTVANEQFAFKDVQVFSADAPTLYTRPEVIGAQIDGDILKAGGTAALKYYFKGTGATDLYTKFNWLKISDTSTYYENDNASLNSSMYFASLNRWQKIQSQDNATITLTKYKYPYIRAVIYPVDSNGTYGKIVVSAPRKIYDSFYQVSNILPTESFTYNVSTVPNDAYKAFDTAQYTAWVSSGAGNPNHYFQFNFERPVVLDRITFSPRGNSVTASEYASYKFIASNDPAFATSVTLCSQVQGEAVIDVNATNKWGYPWGRDIFEETAYRYYRLQKLDNSGASIENIKLFVNSASEFNIQGEIGGSVNTEFIMDQLNSLEGVLLVGLYRDGKLFDIKQSPVTNRSNVNLTFETQTGDQVRAFVWDSLLGLNPKFNNISK